MPERMIEANGIDVCTEAFGDREASPILLVMGAGLSMHFWERGLCEKLAAGGRFVIRYDNRDTGRSTHVDFERQPYTLSDMAADAVGVLDAYGIGSAHAVGMSMGGMIIQHVALDCRSRVRTIALLMSSPDVSGTIARMKGECPPADALPGPNETFMAAMTASADLDWRDATAVIEARSAIFRAIAGSAHPFDEEKCRRFFSRENDRSADIEKTGNHTLASATSAPWKHRLGNLEIPTLVIHGTEDGILPYAHGEALVRAIPGAELLTLEGVGHELPEAEWDRIVWAILKHTEERAGHPQ